MSVPTDQELAVAVNEILRKNDLEKITLRIVMTMLCEKFELSPPDLAHQKKFVRTTINDFLEKTYVPPDGPDTAVEAPRTSNKRKADQTDATLAPDLHQDDTAAPDDDADAASPPAAAAAAAAPLPVVKLTGLERAVVLAQPLAEFIGEVVIPRSHIPKRISAYAKQHNLQDPSDGRKINCDEGLKKALNVDSFTFFTLSKIVSGLVYKPSECDAELQEMARRCEEQAIAEKAQKRAADIANGTVPVKKGRASKKAKKAADPDKPRKPSGLFKPMALSETLQAVVGGVSPLSRSDVLKRIWVYIRENDLKDPQDKMRIVCDDKLAAVFDGEQSVTNMGINKYLSAHMTKID